jgi:hypothetical protein
VKKPREFGVPPKTYEAFSGREGALIYFSGMESDLALFSPALSRLLGMVRFASRQNEQGAPWIVVI